MEGNMPIRQRLVNLAATKCEKTREVMEAAVAELDSLDAENARLREALSLHRSMVLSGESPSAQSEAIFHAALEKS